MCDLLRRGTVLFFQFHICLFPGKTTDAAVIGLYIRHLSFVKLEHQVNVPSFTTLPFTASTPTKCIQYQ